MLEVMLRKYYGDYDLDDVSAFAVDGRAVVVGDYRIASRPTRFIGTIGTADERFSVKFYLVAMIFLAFDIEVAFLDPWAIQFLKGGWEMFAILAAFLVMLEAVYLYLWNKGALDW